jgi:phage shock protein A
MYVALKRLRFGEARLEPGDEVPDEPGRNYNLLLRQGLIADLDAQVRTEEDAAEMAKGYQARIKQLEGALEDAQKEIAALRAGKEPEEKTDDAGTADDGTADDGGKADTGPNLKSMDRKALNAHAKSVGVKDAAKLGNKSEVMKAIEAAGK